MRIEDERLRRRLREELETTFVVEAAAGTGKTTMLVARILSLLRTGTAPLSQLIAVTFTEKAAGEMKLRIRAEIERARNAATVTAGERRHLETALAELEGARIGTIHSLCADLLRERPIDAGVDPLFEVASNEDAPRLLDAAFDAWFSQTLSAPPEGVRRLLRRPVRGDGPTGRKLLRDAAWRLAERRDFDRPWRRPSGFDRDLEIDAVLEALAEFGALADRARRQDFLKEALQEVQRFIEDLHHRESVAPRDYDGLEALLRELLRNRLWKKDGYGKDFCEGMTRADVLARRAAVLEQLKGVVDRCDADLAALLRDELLPVVAGYERQKAAAGKLDFTDLLIKARDLVRDDAGARADLQRRFTHLFVDEFQDTDPLQADLLLLLAADDPAESDPERVRVRPGKLFVVGDPKQSIYAFRRADVALYQRIKERLVAQGAQLVYLSRSFRAQAELQGAVNDAFGPAMGTGSPTQARYVPLELGREDPPPARPTVIALPVPHPYGDYKKIVSFRIRESEPVAIAAFIDFLVNHSGWTVTESQKGAAPIPLRPRHICVLFRRFQSFFEDVTRPYTAELEARRIPHVLVGGRSFHARDEVLALRNALTAIEWPDDELAVFATLRGPLFALQDDALLTFRARFGRMHPLKPLELEGVTPAVREVADALAVLGKLHRTRNRTSIADTVSSLLEQTRSAAAFAFWSAAEQALGNVLHLVERARRFEAQGATSFRAFVETLSDEADAGEAEEARVVEEGTEGVRLMTVHRAKGLEFPVVILADLTASQVQSRPSRHVDTSQRLWAESLAGCIPRELLENEDEARARDAEESTRLAYVAATRARDLLVVPAVGDQPQVDGWLSVLNPVLYPRVGTARSPEEPPGCPPRRSRDTVVDRPDDAKFDPELAVAPGLHVPQVGTHRVVWWDPACLDLGRDDRAPLLRSDLLKPDPSQEHEQQTRDAYAQWETARVERLARGSRPSVLVQTVREAAEAADVVGVAFPVERTAARETPRPRGKRFGALVHETLARVPFDAGREAIERIARARARVLGATDEEVRAGVDAVAAALAHPVWQRAGRPGNDLRREAPLMFRDDDGVFTEGVADLLFGEPDGAGRRWVVVELKTDDLEEVSPQHHAQLGLYVDAVRRATGEPAEGVLILV